MSSFSIISDMPEGLRTLGDTLAPAFSGKASRDNSNKPGAQIESGFRLMSYTEAHSYTDTDRRESRELKEAFRDSGLEQRPELVDTHDHTAVPETQRPVISYGMQPH